MVEDDMAKIAGFIKRTVIDREDPMAIRADVRSMMAGFREVKFSFESGDAAYKYVSL